MTTAEVIAAYYTIGNTHDWDAFIELFDPNVVVDEQLAGRIEGSATLKAILLGMEKASRKFETHPLHVVIDGEEVCAVWKIDAETAAGAPVSAKGVNYFRVVNGKIVYMANFHDSVPFAPMMAPNA